VAAGNLDINPWSCACQAIIIIAQASGVSKSPPVASEKRFNFIIIRSIHWISSKLHHKDNKRHHQASQDDGIVGRILVNLQQGCGTGYGATSGEHTKTQSKRL